MKQFVLFYEYVPNMVERRAPYRDAHLANGRAAAARGELLIGGALLEPVDGAVLLFAAEDKSVVEDFVRADAYFQNGLITAWRVREWTVAFGPERLEPKP